MKRDNIGSDRRLWKNSLHNTIIQVLIKEGKPMRVRDITKKVMEKRNLVGSTPSNTICAILQSSNYTTRVKFGIYKLKKIPKSN